MKKLLSIFALLSCFAVSAAPNTSTIKVNRGEKWWGVFIGGGEAMPFAKPFAKTDPAAWNGDGGSNGIMTPVLISSMGRYIYSKHPFSVEFTGESFIIESDHEKVDAVSKGRTLREAYLLCLHQNAPPNGKTPAPELFVKPVYELHSELGWSAGEASVMEYADGIISSGYPAGTIVIPAGWQSETGSLTPDKGLYGDFSGMVGRLHEKGFRVMLTVTPFVSADGRLFRKHRNDGFFVKDSNGQVALPEWDGGYSACYDITAPEVSGFLRSRLDSLHSVCSVDGFSFDCSAAMPYLNGMQKADYLEKWTKLGDGFDFCLYTASSGSGFDPFIRNITRGGKPDMDFLKRSLIDIINAGMLGYPFCTVSAPVPLDGFSAANTEFLNRYIQLTSVLPVMNIPFAPWRSADAGTVRNARAAVEMRMKIGEYTGSLVAELAKTGEPIVRHMEYVFPKNGFSDCDDQFMVGTKYLVAPLFGESGSRTVRFPRGQWVDAQGKRYRGPLVTTVGSPDGGTLVFESAK